MRKLILAVLAVVLSIMLSYAETCSLSNGSLSYQINGCEEQIRACCTGQWCIWGILICANCSDTSESRNCSGNVTNACAGNQTRTRSVTDTCGGCSYNSWGSWNTWDCTYTQSCTDTSTDCSNVSDDYPCGTAKRTVTNNCGMCAYGNYNIKTCESEHLIYRTMRSSPKLGPGGVSQHGGELLEEAGIRPYEYNPGYYSSKEECEADLELLKNQMLELGWEQRFSWADKCKMSCSSPSHEGNITFYIGNANGPYDSCNSTVKGYYADFNVCICAPYMGCS